MAYNIQMKPLTPQEMMEKNTLVKHYAGSIAYGTNLPDSDTDYRGIFSAEPINILTPFYPVREVSDATEEDTKLFELTHFMKLCLDCNPNIIETLWVDESDIVSDSAAYSLLRSNRERLLSAKIAYSTCGYAMAQLKRIKGHNKWINKPQPEEKPQQRDYVTLIQWFGLKKVMPSHFGLGNFNEGYQLVSYGHNSYGLYENADRSSIRPQDGSLNDNFDGDREDLPDPIAIINFRKDEWRQACDVWENYWKWKNNRNEARSALEEDHGYDTKHAMHLVRLLRMGVEALRDGVILVKRPDAQELLDIRGGSMTYDELVNYAQTVEAQINDLRTKTHLPKNPDILFGAHLLMLTQKLVWNQ